MRERRFGRVIAISSGAATLGLPGQVAYAASKAGLLGLVKTLAAENVRRGITANAVLPGMVATEAVLAMPAEVLEPTVAAAPMGAWSSPRRSPRSSPSWPLRSSAPDRSGRRRRRRGGAQHALADRRSDGGPV